MATRQYDPMGFPVPIDFEPESAGEAARRSFPTEGRGGEPGGRSATPRGRPSGRKKLFVVALLLGCVVPAVIGPAVMPEIREGVVRFSLWRSAALEVEDESAAAAAEVGRAVAWYGEDAELYCLRGRLLLEARDPHAAIRDANRAAALSPNSTEPLRLRAMAFICLGDADSALADANRACSMSPQGDVHALNFRAYVRALVGREIAEGLRDIERAIESAGDRPAELLDTHGYLLHLAGLHEEALAAIEEAIEGMRTSRMHLVTMAGRFSRTEFARQLRSVDHAIAVMLQHRGLVHEALGRKREAREDFEQARRKGFDPTRGIL